MDIYILQLGEIDQLESSSDRLESFQSRRWSGKMRRWLSIVTILNLDVM